MRFIWSWTSTYPVLVTHGNINKIRHMWHVAGKLKQMTCWEGLWGLGFLLCKHVATLTTAVMLITSFCFKQSPSDPLVLVLGFLKSLKCCPLAYNLFCRADKEKAVLYSYYNHFQVMESLQIMRVWKNEVVIMVFWKLTAFFFSEKQSPHSQREFLFAICSLLSKCFIKRLPQPTTNGL